MKRNLLFKTMLLLCAFIVGSSSVWADDTYSKVTSLSGINTTDTYIIVCEESNVAMALYSSGNNHGIVAAAISDGTASSVGSGVCLLTLESTGTSGQYYLKNQNNEYLLAVANQNYLKVSSSKVDACKFSLSYNDENLTISSAVKPKSGTWSYSKLLYNNSNNSTIFACYGTNQNAVAIYKKDVSTDEATSVTIDDSGITNTDIALGTTAGFFAAVVKNSSSEIIDGATVTWTSSKPAVATIDATTGAVTLVKRGTTTITASYAGVSGTYQASNNTYVLNVTNSAANDGSAAHPFTPTEARDALDNDEIESESDYYVRGIIAKKNDISSGSLTYWLSNDGSMVNNIQCYNGKYINGASFTDATDLEVGDIATVKGKLTIYQSTTYEFSANNEVVSITPRTKVNISTFTATTPTIVIGESTETTVTNDQVGWTPVSYTYESDDESVATVDANGVITAVAKGTANITVTANVAPNDATYKAGESKSVEIKVTNPFHNVIFSVNGIAGAPTPTEEGATVTFPADPASVGGKAFVGWITTPIDGTIDEAPTLITSAIMGNADITYYAVYAKATSGIVTKTDKLTTSTFGNPSSYSNWSNKKASDGSDAVYAGNSTTYNNSVIQIRSSNSNSGIVSTTSGGKVKKVTITWNSNTDNGRTLDIYGKNTAYTAATDLYNSTNQGTKIGSIVFGTSTELTITDDYEFIGMRSYSNAMYISQISIDWEAGGYTYSEYCTSIIVPVTITSAKYATFSSPYATDFSTTGVTAYTATDNETSVTLNEITSGKVPANTPVVLYKAGADGTAINVPVIASADAVGSNDLHVVGEGGLTGEDNIFVLSKKNSVVGFYLWDKTKTLNAGKIYLQGSGSSARNFLGFESTTTSINALDNLTKSQFDNNAPMYNLAGQRVNKSYKGIVIVNGKKMLNK